MRMAVVVLVAAMTFCGAGASGALAQAPTVCNKPDSTLLRSRGAYSGRAQLPDADRIELYNAQARKFNECTRSLVEGNNGEIDRVRDEANAHIRRITDDANRRINAIQAKMHWAAGGAVPDDPENLAKDSAFPNPKCQEPDPSLLRTAPRKAGGVSSLARGAEYVRQEQTYNACVRSYLERAGAAAKEIAAAANLEIRRTADDANTSIAGLRSVVRNGIATANSAAMAKSHEVEGTPLSRYDPILQARAAENPLENAKSDPKLWPVLRDTPSGEGDRRSITCRAPQQLPDSHLLGPEVCRRNGVWAELRREGKDVSPDGTTTFNLVESRSTNLAGCNKISPGQGGNLNAAFCN